MIALSQRLSGIRVNSAMQQPWHRQNAIGCAAGCGVSSAIPSPASKRPTLNESEHHFPIPLSRYAESTPDCPLPVDRLCTKARGGVPIARTRSSFRGSSHRRHPVHTRATEHQCSSHANHWRSTSFGVRSLSPHPSIAQRRAPRSRLSPCLIRVSNVLGRARRQGSQKTVLARSASQASAAGARQRGIGV
jgi:hypothetical protein